MANARSPVRAGSLKTPKKSVQIKIRRQQLPLHCPMPNSSLWDSHPRVFLPIADTPDGQIRCPYCGTLYILGD